MKNDLEKMVDASSLQFVLCMLSEVVRDKADHLEANWQDRPRARDYARIADRLDKLVVDARRYKV
jgi:hypothetical protein